MIKNDYDYWENIWRLFDEENPHLAEQAIGWYPSGRHQIVIQYPDGRRDVYNSILSNSIHRKRLRTIYDPKKPVRYTDIDSNDWAVLFGVRLRDKLMARRMDQETLSEITGISRVSISKYINGKAVPSLYNVELIARALGCSLEEFRVDFYDEIERR